MEIEQTKNRTNLIDSLLKRIEIVPASDRFLLRILFFAIISSLLFTLYHLNQNFSSATPTRGGSITEAVLGTPRFVNPVLANTRADQDVTSLVYNGLLKISSDGSLVSDVASAVTVSEDGLTYNVQLRENVYFHDGEQLTAEDVIFTIQLAQDSDLKSPIRGNWSGVTLESVNDFELNIILEEPYAPFTENFTLGIMPAHLWDSLPIEQLPFSQLNTEPIGTGPYAINEAKRDASGVITEYQLIAFGDNSRQPNIQNFIFKFYNQESEIIEALKAGEVDTTGYISNENLGTIDTSTYEFHTMTLPRIFGVFFNQNRSTVLLDDSVREALSVAIDRDALVDEILNGYGVPITTPIALKEATVESNSSHLSTSTNTTIEQAREILTNGDWEQNELGFWEKEIDDVETTLSLTLRTSNTPLFENTLTQVAEAWRAVGVEIVTEQFEQTGLIQSVIRPRDFQALLFGIDMSRSYDLYPFWHSSQKDDPGLNIAQYTNLSVDELLEEARVISDTERRDALLQEASDIIAKEVPAVLLFQPEFVYVVHNQVEIGLPERPGKPADRFSSLHEWHTTSDILWPAFRDDL